MRFLSLFLTLWASALMAAPKADIHMHYKWNQEDVTSVAQALEVLDAQDIELAGVIGTPPELALKLRDEAPNRIFAWYGVYQEPGDWSRWAQNRSVVDKAREAVRSGGYAGIGELHFIGGFIPKWDTPVIRGLLDISVEESVPLLVHVEFSRADYLIGMCQSAPKASFLLAHAGAPMPPKEVRRALESCDNLWWELSARDPMRYVSFPILDESQMLKPEWKKLILDYAHRLMLGSDPVWPVEQLNPWDEPDTGWHKVGDFWDAHEVWLGQLPEAVGDDIRLKNAQRFFGVGGR